MEDIVCTQSIQRYKNIVGVLDGHNGVKAAEIMADSLRSETKDFMLMDDVHFIDLFGHIQKRVVLETDSGLTATVLYLGQDVIKVGYVGDCSVYVINNDGLKKVTTPHSCTNENEQKRVQMNGGTIVDVNGTKRLNGIINVTRSIGDRTLHPPMTWEPEILSINIRKGLKYIVITTDGADTIKFGCDVMYHHTNGLD